MAKLKTTDGAPAIAATQAMYYRVGRFGKMYDARKITKSRKVSDLMQPWVALYGVNPAKLRRQILYYTSKKWKNGLTQTQRDAWATLAASVTIRNYKGVTKTPTGFQMFQATNAADAWRFGMIPFGSFNTAFPILLNPPSPWTPPTPPVISNIRLDDPPFWLLFETPFLGSNDWGPGLHGMHLGAITDPAKQHGPYYDSSGSNSNIVDDHLLWSFEIDFPFFPTLQIRPFTMAIRWVDVNLHTFSDPQWIAVS